MTCAACDRDTVPGEHLCCRICWRRYHYGCFKVEGFPTRLGEGALSARRGDCRRPDFVCEACNFASVMGRQPVTPRDHYLCYLDRLVTIDEFHRDADNMTNTYAIRQLSRWNLEYGVPPLAGSREELEELPADHRHLSWFFVDKSRKVRFQSVRRIRSGLWNYYRRMPGLATELIPTSTPRFTDRFDGLMQRLGSASEQDKVFSTKLLRALLELLESDWRRAHGEHRVELTLANLALHLMCSAGFRPNECFHERVLGFSQSFVVGAEARRMGVRAHFWVRAAAQTKTERYAPTRVLCSFTTAPPCPLRPGMWGQRALAELDRVGRGPATNDASLYLFATPLGVPWRMGWLWAEHIHPRLEQLQREGNGGLLASDDLQRYGTNSPRRSWNTYAASHPHPVSQMLREVQARWREHQRKRQSGPRAMHAHYFEPDLGERLQATYYLSEVGPGA